VSHHQPAEISWWSCSGEEEGIKSPILISWAERLWWAGPSLLGGPSALWTEPGYTVLFIIFPSDLFKSIQILFELWKFIEA
jgi:hypothetical protein